MKHTAYHRADGGRGSVLIVVIWVLTLLTAVAVAVSSIVSASLSTATRLARLNTAYYLARAGVEQSIHAALSDTNGWDAFSEPWRAKADSFREVRLGGGTYSVFWVRPGSDGAVTNFGLCDEEARVNLNRAGLPLLKAFFEVVGGVDPARSAEIAGAVIDWRDADGDQLTPGAESGYYAGLSRPYPCRNGDFQSVHELVLVRGVDDALFARVEGFVTVFGSGKVNINAADAKVLEAVALAAGGSDPGIRQSLARKIEQFREGGNRFEAASGADVIGRLDGAVRLEPPERALLGGMLRLMTVKTTCFRGIATGGGGDAGWARIEFVFDRTRPAPLYWREN